MDPTDVVVAFLEKINAHDVDGLCALMTPDHVFIDACDMRGEGVEAMRVGWKTYLEWFPDYAVFWEHIFEKGEIVGVFGRARGTYVGDGRGAGRHAWDIPAAWKAVVRDARVAEWRVYADNLPARQQMAEKAP